MAQTLEALNRHSQTLASIRGIVRTMKTLSAINATPYENAASSIEAYHHSILQGLAAFAHRSGGITQQRAGIHQQLLLVFGSDHGLCGSYNDSLAALVGSECRAHIGRTPRLLCIGSKMNDALVDHGLVAEAVLLPPASAEGIGRLAAQIVTRIDAIGQQHARLQPEVILAFTQRGTHGLRQPVTRRLLPLDPALLERRRRWPSRSLPDYSMAADALLAALIRSHIFASVFRASAEAMVTENSARLELMQQAEQSVDDRLQAVQSDVRQVRQTEITNELMDVITGFEALRKPAGRNDRP